MRSVEQFEAYLQPTINAQWQLIRYLLIALAGYFTGVLVSL